VVDTLLHPETVERIRAVRQFVEAPSLDPSDSPFPPAPPLDDVPGPLYGALHLNLDWWRQRRVDVFGGGAAELLMTERQLQYYRWVSCAGAAALCLGSRVLGTGVIAIALSWDWVGLFDCGSCNGVLGHSYIC
jgi:hypothetical protein